MRMKHAYFSLAISLAFALGTIAHAQNYSSGYLVLTMDEVATQLINGLTVKGVTFADTAGAVYNFPNGGTLVYTQDPTIEGNSTVGETITINLPYAVSGVQFGFALSTIVPVQDAVSVDLYSDTACTKFIGTFTADAAPLTQVPFIPFAEGLFVSPFNTIVGCLVVTFPGAVAQGVLPFAIDNLAVGTNYASIFNAMSTW